LLDEKHNVNAIVVPMDGYKKFEYENSTAAFTFDAEKFVEDVCTA
jgi:hypothetical protein